MLHVWQVITLKTEQNNKSQVVTMLYLILLQSIIHFHLFKLKNKIALRGMSLFHSSTL